MPETVTTQPGTDLAHQAPDMARGVVTGVSLETRMHYAETLAKAGLVPESYRRQPANVLYAVETGTMLGIHPIAAINGINVIKGKPTVSPALMTALVRRAGHKVRVKVTGTVTAGDIRATCEVIRCDDPTFTYSATWDIARAKRAKLWDKDTWSNYPEAMLKARAIGEVCREAAEDALCGIHYTPEELGATVDVEGEVITSRAEPPLASPPPVDGRWLDQVAAAGTVDALREVWKAANTARAMNPALEAVITARRGEITAAAMAQTEPMGEDIQDAEVVEEDPPAQAWSDADLATAGAVA